ncbi:hypothetical protein D9613_010185 [Agrocybe pediades]|uniref:F-box domain-containing protein n=1 Tax=Agrocybe pediades TaxID=84607 RepID=A0A8H4QXZ5_9AGAR|nr:hypothetical protein D9613_010185 [Agrocybe pediades]
MSPFFSLKKLPEIFGGSNLGYASPVPQLFETNRPPTEEEMATVLEALNKAKEEKATLEQRISLGDRVKPFFVSTHRVGRLRRQLHAIDTFISTHEARIAPCAVMRLPPELLSMIFKVAGAQRKSRNTDWALSEVALALGPVLALSHVCKRWRDVAVSTPCLWQTIPTLVLRRPEWRKERHLQCLEEVLRRGKDSPLFVVFDAGAYNNFDRQPRPEHPAVKILVAHSERWHSVDVTMADPSAIMPQLAPIRGRISSLRSLRLSVSTRCRERLPDCSIFEIAPRLRELCLYNVPFRLTLPTRMELRKLTVGQSIIAVAVTGNWRSLSLVCSSTIVDLQLRFVATGSGNLLPPTLLPNLVSMKVDFQNCPGGWFLNNVTGGSFLQQLELLTDIEEDLSVSAHAFISRSKVQKLTTLTLTQVVAPQDLLSILNCNHHLLHLNAPLPDPTCIVALCGKTDGCGILVPSLTTCRFEIREPIPSATIKLLQTFTKVRFDSSNASTHRPGESQDSIITCPGLETLSIHHSSTNPKLRHATYCALNGWKAPRNLGPEFEEVIIRVKRAVKRIEIARLLYWQMPTKAELQETESDLRRIYEYDGFTVSDLMFTGLPEDVIQLKKASWALDYRDIATQILEKWDPILCPAYGPDCWRKSNSNWFHYGSTTVEGRITVFSRVRDSLFGPTGTFGEV